MQRQKTAYSYVLAWVTSWFEQVISQFSGTFLDCAAQNAEVLANGKIRMPAYLDLLDLLPALHSFYQTDNISWRPNAQPSISTLRLVVREKFPHLVSPLGSRALCLHERAMFI